MKLLTFYLYTKLGSKSDFNFSNEANFTEVYVFSLSYTLISDEFLSWDMTFEGCAWYHSTYITTKHFCPYTVPGGQSKQCTIAG